MIQFKGKSINTGQWKEGYYFFSATWQRHIIVTVEAGRDSFNIVEPESVEMVDLGKIKRDKENHHLPHVCQRYPDFK